MKTLTFTILLLSVITGISEVAPNFKKVEERGGWKFETTRLDHGVRLNRRTWLLDQTKVSYNVYIDGKNLWTIDFDNGRVYFTPVLLDLRHISSHLDTNTEDKYIIDLFTPGHTGYIASLVFDRATTSVSVLSPDELKLRAEQLGWVHTTPYKGQDFSDPEGIFAGRLPIVTLDENKSEKQNDDKEQNKTETKTPRDPSD